MTPIDITNEIAYHYICDQKEVVDSALVRKIDGYRRSRAVAELAQCSRHFDSALHSIGEWRFLRQVEAFYKKNACFSHPETCAAAALAGFKANEEQCSQANHRLRPYVGYLSSIEDEELRVWVTKMARYISSVLGDFNSFRDALPHLVKVTPGATASCSRRHSLPQMKMRMTLYAPRAAHQYLRALYRFFGFGEPRLRPVVANRVELVPKNWKTSRTIACEPEGVLPLQLAFDTYAKRRLRRVGIDLSDQSANKRMAKHASIHDDFVTVDFSAASDTISYNAVSLVFPVDWFDYLRRVRTPAFSGVFGQGVYSKFSSMGNGSTFTIETLLFAAACYAVGSRKFLVYGDDVIVEKEFYQAYIKLTRFLGFTINEEKSFADGPFRESCGGDYYDGIDVTPMYIRSIDGRKANYCHLVNTMAQIALPQGSLAKYLRSLSRDLNLPLVPFNESTLSGVWIDPDLARTLGLLQMSGYTRAKGKRKAGESANRSALRPLRGGFLQTFKSYTARFKRKSFVDSRGYYLWFLYKHSQVLFNSPWEIAGAGRLEQAHSQTSWAPVFDHAYARKRVCWQPPANGLPDHLYWWSEHLDPRRPYEE